MCTDVDGIFENVLYLVSCSNFVVNYIPVSSTSVACKQMEHVIASHLRKICNKKDWLFEGTRIEAGIFMWKPSNHGLLRPVSGTSPARKMEFMVAGVPLPPEPVIRRWGTWIDATIYYCVHFQVVILVAETEQCGRAASLAPRVVSVQWKWKRQLIDYCAITIQPATFVYSIAKDNSTR
jgi:hypothetical protein